MISLEINGTIFWATIAGAVLWLAISLLALPRLRRRILRAGPDAAPRLAASMATASILRDMAVSVVLAGIIVLGCSIILRSYLESLQATEEGIQAVVAIRDRLEQTLDYIGSISTGLWIFAIGGLGLLWLLLARSASRSRWLKAIEARKSALLASLLGKQTEALREELEQVSAGATAEFDRRVQHLAEGNRARIQEMQTRPALELSGRRVSLQDLRDLEQQLQQELDQEQAAGNEAEQQEKREAANNIKAVVEEIERQIPVELMTLSGYKRSLMLAEARGATDPDTAEIDAALREKIADLRLRQHRSEADSKARREPELLREWIAAGTTSELTVAGTSYAGRLSGTVAMVAFLLGFVGLNSIYQGPSLLSGLQAVELALTIDEGQNAITTAARAQPEPEPADEQLASDEATANYLRQSFRVSLAQSLRSSLGVDALTGETGRHRLFSMSAADARQEILALSARSAADTLDPGLETPRVEASTPREDVHPHTQTGDVLDEARDRQIKRLQAEEGVWRSLRASASRPAGRAYVADRFLATLFGSNRIELSHAMAVWSERVTGEFASYVAAGGKPEAFVPSRSAHLSSDAILVTMRDQRIIADFEADAPERFARRFDDLRRGDPGSLHRAAPRLNDTHVVAAIRPSVYDTLFPTGSEGPPPPDLGPAPTPEGGSGGGGGGSPREASRPRTARPVRTASAPIARSYSRVRLSGRVGGVVIGREPDNPDTSLDVGGFDWTTDGNGGLVFTLTARNGKSATLGPIHPAIAHHALAYAADGRVIVSTLPLPTTQRDSGLNISVRRVAVHPAFEDTAFACPAIQIDRFVDSFTHTENADLRIARINRSREAVTQLGNVLSQISRIDGWKRLTLEQRIMSLLSDEGQRQLRNSPRYRLPSQREEFLQQVAASPDIAETLNRIDANIKQHEQQLEQVLDDITPVSDWAKSCGTGEKCFPVKTFEKLGLQFTGVDSVLGCLVREAQPKQCARELRAISSNGSYLVDSGVREAAFTLDDSFNFLTGANATTPYWPLDFIIQAVPQTEDGQDLQLDDAAEPWIFPLAAADIRAVVAEGIATDDNAKSVLGAMRQFVIMQRLFRLALEGKLGLDFPLGQLVKMQRETHDAVRVQRHERWNPNGEFFGILRGMESEFGKDLETITADAAAPEQCKAAARAALEQYKTSPWPQSVSLWPFVGDFEHRCAGYSAPSGMIEKRDSLRQLELIGEAIYTAQRGFEERQFQCSPL